MNRRIRQVSMMLLVCGAALSGAPARSGAAQPPAERESQAPATARDAEAAALVTNILSQYPEADSVIYGRLRVRDEDGRRFEVPLKYTIKAGGESWTGVYEAKGTSRTEPQVLVVTFRGAEPNQYVLSRFTASYQPVGQPRTLTGAEIYAPFAGSDYWIADFGLEFLHWPDQRLVRDAKITMRKGRSCHVLESVLRDPPPGAYSRVVSWIDREYGFPVYAEAFGQDGKRLKVFSLKSFKKVHGRWEVREMEIRNERTDSSTTMEFIFHTEG